MKSFQHIGVALAGVVGLLAAGVSAAAPGATGADAFDGDDPRVRAELVVDADTLRPGQPVRIGVLLDMDPGWHVYWRNAGESGLPTELAWDFPGAEVGPIRWPVPAVFEESDGFLTTYGYADQVLLTNEAVVSASAAGMARIAVTVDFVTCHIGCIPGSIELARVLPVSNAGGPAPAVVQQLFASWERRLPVSPEALGLQVDALQSLSAVRPADDFKAALVVRCPAASRERCGDLRLAATSAKDAFIPEELPTVELETVAHVEQPDAGFALVIDAEASPDDPGSFEQRMRGLVPVSLSAAGETAHIEIDVPLARTFAGQPVVAVDNPLWTATGGFAPPTPDLSLLYAFGLALLGGLILNLMPCVLPILAIKVFHVAEVAHHSRREVLGHGAAYTAGVLASMAALAGVVIGLRAAGTAVGWGFQFQEPVFIAGMATLLVVFALNLFGVFEVTFQPTTDLGAGGTGLRRSFFEGLLAVVLATPCTAPFLGTAVGFAFASSSPVILAMFLAIGLGLAAPYAMVALVPGWAKLIPRPGAWMVQVRRVLGFSLIATVVWLLWVMGRSVGVDAQALVLAYLVAVAFLAWVFGVVQRSPGRGRVLASGVACLVLAAIGMVGLPLDPAPRAALADGGEGATGDHEVVWRPYDLAVIRGELAQGRPVFVDFTADWCITCKVNESVVLDDSRVKQELSRLAVATFKADWTLYDDDIRQVLASFGKAGVPMYLVYGPASPGEPVVLPELLTVDVVLDALRNAAGPSGAALTNAPGGDSEPSPVKGRQEKS